MDRRLHERCRQPNVGRLVAARAAGLVAVGPIGLCLCSSAVPPDLVRFVLYRVPARLVADRPIVAAHLGLCLFAVLVVELRPFSADWTAPRWAPVPAVVVRARARVVRCVS